MQTDNESWVDCPKFLMKDLKKCKKLDEFEWEYDIEAKYLKKKLNKSITFRSVYLQGFIEQKPCEDVMILRDCSGRVKLTNCGQAVEKKFDPITKGSYCYLIGVFIRETGLPEVFAQKLTKLEHTDVDKDLYYKHWPYEVKDFLLFLLGVVKPNLGLDL